MPDPLRERNRAVFSLLVCAFLWSAGGLFIKQIDLSPLAIAGSRAAIAAIALLPFIRFSRIDWSGPQIAGAVTFAAAVILFITATKLTTAANAIFLQYTAPIYVALLSSLILREKAAWYDWACVGAVIGGMIMFFLGRLEMTDWWGNAAAIGSGVAMAAGVLALRKQKDGSPLESIWLGNVLTAAIGLPFFFGRPLSTQGWLSLLFLGLIQQTLPQLLYTRAIKRILALEAVLILTIEPILNPLWVFLVLGEKPGPWALAGGAVVLAAVTVRSVVAIRAGRISPGPRRRPGRPTREMLP